MSVGGRRIKFMGGVGGCGGLPGCLQQVMELLTGKSEGGGDGSSGGGRWT